MDDIALVQNSKAAQDDHQNILVYNQSARPNNAQRNSPSNLQYAEDDLNASPYRKYNDDRSGPLFAEPTKIPTSVLKRELRDNSHEGTGLSRIDTKPSPNGTLNESRRLYNY